MAAHEGAALYSTGRRCGTDPRIGRFDSLKGVANPGPKQPRDDRVWSSRGHHANVGNTINSGGAGNV